MQSDVKPAVVAVSVSRGFPRDKSTKTPLCLSIRSQRPRCRFPLRNEIASTKQTSGTLDKAPSSTSTRRNLDDIVIIRDQSVMKGINRLGHGSRKRGKPHGRNSVELVAGNRTNKRC